MLPIGTRVTVKSVDHLGFGHPPRHLVGRTAVVADHDRGMNIVAHLTGTERLTGYYVFADSHLTVNGSQSAPRMPRRYRVQGYRTPQVGAR